MARTRTPRVEGEDRQVEHAESGVTYLALSKPEAVEVADDELTEGFEEVPAVDGGYRDEDSVRAKITEMIEAAASITRTETYFLWHEGAGRLFSREYNGGPWERAAAQRRAGYRRFVGSVYQEQPNFRARSNVWEDDGFDTDADYLEATDQLSEPFENDSLDPEFGEWLFPLVSKETRRHDGFESLVLGRPQRRKFMDQVLASISSEPADAPDEDAFSLAPNEAQREYLTKHLGQFPDDLERLLAGPHLELCRFRGMVPSIPELSGSEWVRMSVIDGGPHERDFLEAVAKGFGNDTRVFVEGASGKVQVLIPVRFGFVR